MLGCRTWIKNFGTLKKKKIKEKKIQDKKKKVLFALCFPFRLDFKIIYPDTVTVKENVSSKLPHIQKLNGPKFQIPTL